MPWKRASNCATAPRLCKFSIEPFLRRASGRPAQPGGECGRCAAHGARGLRRAGVAEFAAEGEIEGGEGEAESVQVVAELREASRAGITERFDQVQESFQLRQAAAGRGGVLQKLRGMAAAAPFGQVQRNRHDRPPDLIPQRISLVLGQHLRNLIDPRHQLAGRPPNPQPLVIHAPVIPEASLALPSPRAGGAQSSPE